MKKTVIFTIGAPAAGKSTYALEYQNTTSGIEILERDIIRETLRPGYTYQNKIDHEFEKKAVTDCFYEQLENFFANPTKSITTKTLFILYLISSFQI